MRNRNSILVTGCAGFIGFHIVKRFLEDGIHIIGLDNLNQYYDLKLKKSRLVVLQNYHENFTFIEASLENRIALKNIFNSFFFNTVIHMAAQAGVRNSIEHPHVYIDSNVMGFMNILEECRHNDITHLIYASSSSVYGANAKKPFSVQHNVDHPVSLYAATKKANELMAHAYSHLFNLPTTGLRFFTVYGPWGRPDMALFKFTKAIMKGETIKIFNYGNMKRDFTYIDDVVESIIRLVKRPPKQNFDWDRESPDPSTSFAPFKIYNIGNNNPVDLMKFIEVLETKLGKTAKKELLPLQAGDVIETYADVNDLINEINYKPSTPIEVGIEKFVEWYKSYYNFY